MVVGKDTVQMMLWGFDTHSNEDERYGHRRRHNVSGATVIDGFLNPSISIKGDNNNTIPWC
jgi:hypothetical protein